MNAASDYRLSGNSGICCFYCGRDLGMALAITYTADGPACQMCLAKIEGYRQKEANHDPQN